MTDNKKYYYLKLKDSYFDQDKIKIIEGMENGYIYSLIILKLYLKSCKYEGKLMMTSTIPYDPNKLEILAKVLNHDISHLRDSIKIASELDIITIIDSKDIWMTDIQDFIGHTSTEAIRKAKYRAKLKKTEFIDKRLEIPKIDKYNNQSRYNGNYYKVLERDNNLCALCFSGQNIVVHHIDLYDKDKPENNKIEKLITLCSKCHGRVHADQITKKQVLLALDRTITGQCPKIDTPEKDIEIEIKKEIDSKKSNKFIKPTIEEIKAYCEERNNNIDPVKFYNYYESVDWMRGKNKIKKWKSCVITWETNNKFNNQQEDSNPYRINLKRVN